MILDIPRFHGYVDKSFVTAGKEVGLLECYVFSVTIIEARPLLFTIHTVDGAIYSRLPIWALRHKECAIESQKSLDQWGAISSCGQVISHQYLKDYWTEVSGFGSGIYKFTIDYFSGGFSEDPLQHKTSNVIFLDNGLICVMPNNSCLFKDRHFTVESGTMYSRNSQYFSLD